MQRITTILPVVVCTALLLASPLVNAAGSNGAQHVKTGRHAGAGLWNLPTGHHWNRNNVSIDWSIPPASQRWIMRDRRLDWSIPATAAELQQRSR